jgi:hypothetical protein
MISLILPKSHRDTMEVLFVFLKWVASFAHMDAETGSKMDLGNLATVICPSILYARGRDAMRDETFGALRVVTSLLENQDEFFTVPEEFLGILHDQEYFANALELPGKDFLKKCETYMRLKGTNGRALPGTPHNGQSNGNRSYPIQNSPSVERPGLVGPSQSERNLRPQPSHAASFHSTQLPVGSPPMQTPSNAQQMFQWTQQADGKLGQQPPLPSSYLPRSAPDTPGQLAPNTNGYSPAARQHT